MNRKERGKKECSGCTACYDICPKNAISLYHDEEGFIYPKVEQKLCIDCGLCNQVCPFECSIRVDNKLQKVYAAKNKEDSVRERSASGGVFTAISDLILHKNGVIYGAVYNANWEVQHIRAVSSADRDRMCGSKYVQSSLNHTYKEVKEDLEQDKWVLFTGTPCQVAGLRMYLGKEYSTLLTCDIICHGVPSPLIFQEYIKYLENRHKSKLKHLCFRDKQRGWINQMYKAEYENGKVKIDDGDLLRYKKLFYEHYILRPSCHNCKFTNLNRPSDLTLGDFFNVKAFDIDLFDSLGVSIVLVNTDKGKEILETMKDVLFMEEVKTNVYMQPQLKKPTTPAKNRDAFWKEYKENGFNSALAKYVKLDMKTKVKLLVPRQIKESLRKIEKGL